MRHIGQLANQKLAERIGDYLYLQRIENTVQPEENGAWSLWVHDDNQITTAKKTLAEFLQTPNAARFYAAEGQAKQQRMSARRQEKHSRTKQIDVRTQWHRRRLGGNTGRVTLGLILISVAAALITGLGHNREILPYLSITHYQVVGGFVQWRPGLHEILQGQVWRLITPIFIHFGFLHLIFNMLWLKDLGSMIEFRQSAKILLAQVVVMGVLSNLAQYAVSGPTFGGMSGVVYGLLGYIWIRGKLDPTSGLFLHKTIVIWMLVWFALCWTGLIGNVANTAHAVGLLSGIAWGYLSASVFKKR